MAHNSRFWHLGEAQHPNLSTLFPGNVPTGVEAFPWCSSFTSAPLPKALWIGYRNLRSAKELGHLEEHGSVFTRSPSLRNPYTIQLISVLSYLERSIFKSVTWK